MATMVDRKSEYKGEAKVWDSLANNLSDDIVVYNNREVNGREFDFCLFIENKGILIIEVKGWAPSSVKVNGIDDIEISGYTDHQKSPKKQARAYRFAIFNKLKKDYNSSPLVYDMVAYPFITKEQYYKLNLDIISEPEITIFKEDLEDRDLLVKKLDRAYELVSNIPHSDFDKNFIQELRCELEPNFESNENEKENLGYSRLLVRKNDLDKDEIDKIVYQYVTGVKQYIFTDSRETFLSIVNQLDLAFKKMNIGQDGNNLVVGYRKINTNTNKVTLFNLEMYYVENLNEICSLDIDVYEGKVSEKQLAVLEELSKITSFNIQQFRVVHASTSTNTLVEAGAGTGKTFSMVSRVAFLCNKSKDAIRILSEELAMVTFTNEAANNMKKRIKQMFVNYFILTKNVKYLKFIEDVDRTNISTIHKFALEILRKASLYTGLGTNFSISSNKYNRDKIYSNYLENFLNSSEEENPNFINEMPVPVYELKNKAIEIADVLMQKSVDLENIKPSEMGTVALNNIPFFNDIIEKVVLPAERDYLLSMENENSIDLKETIILLNKILDYDKNLVSYIKFRYLFIDEFQDTDDMQIVVFQKLQKIIKSKCRMFVVGDLKQSIYRFRGAKLSAFDQLRKSKLFEWDDFRLNINYRTDFRLLDIYDDVFMKMGGKDYLPYNHEDRLLSRVKKEISEKDIFQCIPCSYRDEKNYFDELANAVLKQKEDIFRLNLSGNLSAEEKTIAILVRSNWQVDMVVSKLQERGIPVEIKSGGDLFQLKSTLDFYKLILALENSYSTVCLINLIESNYVNIRLNYGEFYELEESNKLSYLISLLDDYLINRTGKNWSQLLDEIHSQPVLYVIKQLFDKLKPWTKYSTDIDEQNSYISNYEFLIEKIIRTIRIDSLTLNQIEKYLEVNITTEQKEMSRNCNSDEKDITVICTTVHKSKGLEYGTVILPYTFEDISELHKSKVDASYSEEKLAYKVYFSNQINEKNSNYDEQVEVNEQISEECRVLYVALTRAIRNCIWMCNIDKNDDICWGSLLEV